MVAGLALVASLVPALAQAAKPGDLDRSFGGDGEVKTSFFGHASAESIVIDGPGRIVAAGGDFDFALARYRQDGALDPTFGEGGTVTSGFAGGNGYVASSARSVVRGVSGRPVAAGTKCNYEDPDLYELLGCEFALARYKKDGTLDPSFGDGGRVTTGFPSGTGGGFSAATWAGRRTVVAGGDGHDFALVRYRRHGDLDPTFGAGGKVTTDFGGMDYASAVAIDSERRILAAGTSDFKTFALARYNADGSLDSSFGNDGKVMTSFRRPGTVAYSATIRPGGRIVAAGGSDGRFALARYRPNGRLDRTFSHNGKRTTSFGDRPRDRATAREVAVDSRRRIVAVGGGFKLARYTPKGRLDRSFGDRGKVNLSKEAALARSVATDSRDRIIVAGGHTRFLLARLIGYSRR